VECGVLEECCGYHIGPSWALLDIALRVTRPRRDIDHATLSTNRSDAKMHVGFSSTAIAFVQAEWWFAALIVSSLIVPMVNCYYSVYHDG
jgi:hypothetical protein